MIAFVSLGLGSCAHGFQPYCNVFCVELRKQTINEMDLAIPFVKAEDLQQCRDILERTDLLGAKYQVAGEMQPSISHSCAVQENNSIIKIHTDYVAVAYAARMVKVAGVYGTGSPQEIKSLWV